MKATRKVLAFLLSAGMALGHTGSIVSVTAEEFPDISSTITEDGTIITKANNSVSFYTPQQNTRQYWELDDGCCAVVIRPTDAKALIEQFADDYRISTMEDGRLCLVGLNAPETFVYQEEGSLTNETFWQYEDAKASVVPLLRSGYVKTLTLQTAYRAYDANYVHPKGTLTVYANRQLTDADFSWLESDAYTLNGNEAELLSGGSGTWETQYNLMKTILETVPDVYAVWQKPAYFNAIYVGPTFTDKAVYTAQDRGDITGDFEVDTFDAYEALLYCAKEGAGYDAAFTDGDEVKETTAYASADVNGDGKIDTNDAYLILKYYAEKSAGYTPSWELK